ncbi:hypothetical protein N9V96_01260 [Polaribacter sp.]|nr:hypothetical protein [Polaribacter sp.]
MLCFFSSKIHTQQIQLPVKTSKIAFSEKIYLQLNSTVFTSDQTIWFKAVVTDVNQIPTILSNILHVELIDFDKRIIDTKLVKLENGIANSSFDLQELLPLPAGKYMLRAYTKWNTNFKEDFIFRQYIDIFIPRKIKTEEEAIRDVVISEKANKQLELSAKIYPRTINPKYRGKLFLNLDLDGKKDSIEIKKTKKTDYYSFNYLLPKDIVRAKMNLQLDSIKLKNNNLGFLSSYSKTFIIDKNFIDLQFFPEGGKLIHGLKSILGFKALDYKNEGIQVSGTIVEENETFVSDFKSNELGMGMCQLKADSNKTYHAVIQLKNNIKYKFKIPKIYAKGYVLRARSVRDFLKIQIVSNFSKKDSLFIKVQARGVTYHNLKVQSKDGKVNLAVDKKNLPEGIITFTLFNEQHLPVCERLVFNYKEDSNRIKITTKTNKKRFLQRDKVVFDLNVKQKDSLQNTINSSFLVLNKKQLGEMQLKRNNILSYFLLQSELKGIIEQPNYYFDINNKHHFYEMDVLLLTQGWRNYVYKTSNEKIKFSNQPEQNLHISGNIPEYQKKKRKKLLELTLLTFGKKDNQIDITTVDSLGQFNFNLNDSYNNNLEYIIQTKNHKGKNKTYTINISKDITPKVNFHQQQKVQLADTFTTFVKENIKRFAKENPYSVGKNGFTLDEIKIKARLLTPQQEKMNEEYGEPDVVIEDKELHSKIKKWSYGLYSILLFNYPDDINVTRSDTGSLHAKVISSDITFVFVDGIPVRLLEYPLLESLPTEEIKSIEIIKNPKNSISVYHDVMSDPLPFPRPIISFLNIYSYTGKGLFGIQKTNGIFKNTLPSFAPKKEFYTPKYTNLTKSDWDFPDLRSVVYWQPDVNFDENGNGKVEFYTDDNIGEMFVIVESISEDGKLGYYETNYKVHERLVK